MARKPSITSVLIGDWPTLSCLLAAGLFWGFLLLVGFAGRLAGWPNAAGMSPERFLIAMGLVVNIVCVLISLSRVVSIRRFFARGIAVTGRIIRVGTRGNSESFAEITYKVDGQELTTRSEITQPKEFPEGETVELVVDPNEPSRAILSGVFRKRS